MIIKVKARSLESKFRIFSIFLIIFQSLGIRFFSGQGVFISTLIILLNFKALKHFAPRDYRFLFLGVIFLVINTLVNSSFFLSSFIYQFLLIFSTYLFIVQYKGRFYLLQEEFFSALSIFAYHAMIGYLIYLLIPEAFNINVGLNKSFSYLFYVSNSNFMGVQRNTGVFWEPGVMQLAMNLYLFYCIKFNQSKKYLLVATLVVISTFSTTGLIILVLNFVYFLYKGYRSRRLKIYHLFPILPILIFFVPIINQNAEAKFNEKNTSGLVRLRDLEIGLNLIKEKPLIGHGFFDEQYLSSKNYVRKIENNIFTEGYLDVSGEMSGGYTNGLLGLIAWYGIPMSLLLYYFFYKNNFIEQGGMERLLFCAIPLISMISEPIAYTSFFLMFPLSHWILSKNYHQKYNEHDKLNYSHL